MELWSVRSGGKGRNWQIACSHKVTIANGKVKNGELYICIHNINEQNVCVFQMLLRYSGARLCAFMCIYSFYIDVKYTIPIQYIWYIMCTCVCLCERKRVLVNMFISYIPPSPPPFRQLERQKHHPYHQQ